jgi:hypothetical protein
MKLMINNDNARKVVVDMFLSASTITAISKLEIERSYLNKPHVPST